MNKERRSEIKKIVNHLEFLLKEAETLKEQVESVLEEERNYLEGMPENLRSSEKAEAAEAAIDQLESAEHSAENIIQEIDNCIHSCVDAME